MSSTKVEPEALRLLRERIGRVCSNSSRPPRERLADVCRLLHDEVPGYDWVGFYVVEPPLARELVLGPFVGAPTEHVRIPFGRGVCGQAAELRAAVVVDDVTRESNYLACSLDVKSEIVLPVFRGQELRGELDIDSHRPARFTADDRAFLSAVAEAAGALL